MAQPLTLGDRLAATTITAHMHRRVFRLTRGRLGNAAHGVPVLMLTTTGRTSGLPRQTMLMYLRHEADFLVIAANAADPERPPHWYLNLHAHPQAQVLVEGVPMRVTAQELSVGERAQLWPELVDYNPRWGRYQAAASRVFPVMRLVHGPGHPQQD